MVCPMFCPQSLVVMSYDFLIVTMFVGFVGSDSINRRG